MGEPDRFANDRLAGRYMAYQMASNSEIALAMLEATSSECTFTHAITAGDFDDDGRDDALVFNGTCDSTAGMYTFEYMSVVGGDGTELWGQSSVYGGWWIDDIPAVPVDDLDGDGKRDVIVISRSYDSTTDEYTASVDVRRGYDGNIIWSQSNRGEDVWMKTDYYNWYWWYQDFDGDNLYDPLITTGILIDYTEVPTRVCAVKGISGASLWCEPSSETPTPPPVTGDLNGDDAITPADAVIALEIVVSGDYNNDADVNDDGVVNSLDVLMILQAALGAITL